MNAPLVSEECDHDQNEHYDEDNALFIFGEFENSEQALHFGATQFGYLFSYGARPFFVRNTADCHSERSEESRIIVSKRPVALLARDV